MDLLLVLLALLLIFLNKKMEWVLVIIMALCTDLFLLGSLVENVCIFPQLTDGALCLVMLLFLLPKRSKIEPTEDYKLLNKIVKLFFCYLSFLIVIDLILNGISLLSIVKTSRHWLFLLFLYVVARYPKNVLSKALTITLWIVVIISTLILLESVLGVEILFERKVGDFGILRGKLPPYYGIFFSILVYANYLGYNKTKQYLLLAILVLPQLLSATRSVALAIFLGILLYIYFFSKNKLRASCKILVVCMFLGGVVFSIPSLRYRILDVQEEFKKTNSKEITVEGNTTFRLALLAERYEYLKKNPQYFLFGLGNVHERDFPEIFEIGLHDEERGRTIQLDTGDIAWVGILLRMGIVGVSLFILAFMFIIRQLLMKKDDVLDIALGAYLVSVLLVLSFAGSTYGNGHFWILPLICIFIHNKNHHIDLPKVRRNESLTDKEL